MAALPQLLLTLFPAVTAVVFLLVASAPGARAHVSSSSSSSATYRCGWCPRRSTASILPPDAGALTGAACGYGGPAAAGEMAVDGGFHIAAVSAGFFRGGQACGACYQLRCRGWSACAKDGVKVVVVGEVADANMTAAGRFLLTKGAFAAMTIPDRVAELADEAVDVDFRRIPCAYKSKNLAVKVEETSSRERGYLALRFLYQGGQTDIAAVEVAQAVTGSSGTNNDAAPTPLQTSWQYMTRREESASVWRTSRVRAGPLRLRLVVTAGSGGKWLRADGAVLSAEWQPGAVYDTGLRVTDVAANTCGAASCSAMDEVDDAEQLR